MFKLFTLALSLTCTAAFGAAQPDFRSGDLIFQTSLSQQSQVIQIASGSLYSHVGIVEVQPNGEKFVVEAISRVSRTPLSSWIARGKNGRYALYRSSALSETTGRQLVQAAKYFLGRAYDIYFTSLNNEIYCSELVDLAARKIGLKIGQYQKLGSLNMRHPQVRKLIEARWRGHPLCRSLPSFEACWGAIMQDSLITPVALARDSSWRKIYSSHPGF